MQTLSSEYARRGARTKRQHAPREHYGADGFSWHIEFPERTAAVMGARKPLAKVCLQGAETHEVRIPVAVARALEKRGEAEPVCKNELLHLVKRTMDTCAWQLVVDMASRREYSAHEATERLCRDGFSRPCAERIVSLACEKRVISDKRFVESFVRSKLSCGWGTLRIERELKQRGVDPGTISGWPDAFLGDEAPYERACEALRTKRIPETNAYPKLMRYLISRGHAPDTAKQAVKAKLSACEDTSDFY